MSYKGLQQYCYQLGFDHAQIAMPDPVGEAIAVAPCTIVPEANKAYGQGITDALIANGIIKPEEVKKN